MLFVTQAITNVSAAEIVLAWFNTTFVSKSNVHIWEYHISIHNNQCITPIHYECVYSFSRNPSIRSSFVLFGCWQCGNRLIWNTWRLLVSILFSSSSHPSDKAFCLWFGASIKQHGLHGSISMSKVVLDCLRHRAASRMMWKRELLHLLGQKLSCDIN